MNRVIVNSRVDSDGVLRVTVPVGVADANQEVQVTIEPARAPRMTSNEWRTWVRTTAGSVTDPTFRRHEQGAYEEREPLS
jgi:hypothetical protein